MKIASELNAMMSKLLEQFNVKFAKKNSHKILR